MQQSQAVPQRDVIDLTMEGDESPGGVPSTSVTRSPDVVLRQGKSVSNSVHQSKVITDSVGFPQLLADHGMEGSHNALNDAPTPEFIRTGFFSVQDTGIINRPQKPSPNPKLITEISSGKLQDATTEHQQPPNEFPQDGGSGLHAVLPIFMTHIDQMKEFTSRLTEEQGPYLELCRGLFGQLERTVLLVDATENKRRQIQEANARANAAKRALIDQRKAELLRLKQQSQKLRDEIAAAPLALQEALEEMRKKQP
ncbi:hypothetical protein Pelo_4350 [Pelomyxa schiedti]|nr:hypothetical protein Pelo_4350 [Pelomyxa schiedti]